jgi:UDP-N-acetylmuramate dehydrogenase
MKIEKNVLMSEKTRLKVGGPADFFAEARDIEGLIEALKYSRQNNIPFMVIGEGTNLLVSDSGIRGLVVKICFSGYKLVENNAFVTASAGTNLMDMIGELAERGVAGMEKMYGIPGTVGAAVYGNVGAYGQETKDSLVSVRYWDGEKAVLINNQECAFGYRTSIFKQCKDWIVLEAMFQFSEGDRNALKKTIAEISSVRDSKYPKGLACPGSFFKNIELSRLSSSQLESIKPFLEKVKGNKLAAGVLLEAVGAKGMGVNGAKVASYHGNLIYNDKTAKASDVAALAGQLKHLVLEKYGIMLEPEVQYVGEIS